MEIKHNVVQTIEHNELRKYGHVCGMKKELIPKLFLNWNPKRRRRSGRPRITWKSAIEESLKAYKLIC